MSQPPNTRSFRLARGTKSLIYGLRPSVRLPRRIVAIWVSDPTGCASPLLDGLDSRHKGGRDRSDTGDQDSELAFGGRNLDVLTHWQNVKSP